MTHLTSLFAASLLTSAAFMAGCNSNAQVMTGNSAATPAASAGQSVTVRADVWVDNWFKMSVNGQTVLEDSTRFKTERSFNADSGVFEITLPATIALELRDYYEDDTGLEYIGSNRQQMGDGGGVAQIVDVATGKTLFVTDENMQCKVIHRAPLNKSCERERNPVAGQGLCQSEILPEPAGWMDADFDDSSWMSAKTYSSRAVSPKRDYQRISWDSDAEFIWGEDLEIDNIVLCRATIEG